MLDIGSGSGVLADYIAKRYELDLTCIDTICNLQDFSMQFARADGRHLPFSDDTFNLVSAISIIEHIPRINRDKFLSEVRRVLTGDGLFFLQIPNRYFPIEPHSYLPFIGYFPSKVQSLFYTNHCDMPSLKEVEDLLKTNHFFIIQLTPYKIIDIRLPRKIIKLLKTIPRIDKIPFGYIILARSQNEF